jgi:hypothetical protein
MGDPPVLVLEPGPASFLLRIEKTMESRPDEPSVERRDAIVAMTAHSIKQLSRTGVKLDEITHWVKTHMPEQGPLTTFVQNIPIEVLLFIEQGVMHYGGGIDEDD